jgi:NAD(P)-dependent dehydrogenase (short-subunit alcohol dehydrogenase family)
LSAPGRLALAGATARQRRSLLHAKGARIFCVDVNLAAAEETVRIIKGEGGEALAHRVDASRAADVAAMIEACVSAYDRIDVLDNNVGVAEVGGLVEVSEADWDRVFAVNLKSAYLTMKQTIPLMVRQGGGSIINISSIASIRYTGVPYATYYASKAALNQLTRTTAVEYASRRVRVNAILPGLTRHRWWRRAQASPSAMLEGTSPKCGVGATSRSQWDSAATPGMSPGRRSILLLMKAATSLGSNWLSTAVSR